MLGRKKSSREKRLLDDVLSSQSPPPVKMITRKLVDSNEQKKTVPITPVASLLKINKNTIPY